MIKSLARFYERRPFDFAPFDVAPFDFAPFDVAPFDVAQGRQGRQGRQDKQDKEDTRRTEDRTATAGRVWIQTPADRRERAVRLFWLSSDTVR